mmetsp:Transcript_5491/g.9164  ORF Transcript_5491/g.9164 Transcript_5491/m.9164 type:complete len:203 (+) Transcript_5491:439-1047(+)
MRARIKHCFQFLFQFRHFFNQFRRLHRRPIIATFALDQKQVWLAVCRLKQRTIIETSIGWKCGEHNGASRQFERLLLLHQRIALGQLPIIFPQIALKRQQLRSIAFDGRYGRRLDAHLHWMQQRTSDCIVCLIVKLQWTCLGNFECSVIRAASCHRPHHARLMRQISMSLHQQSQMCDTELFVSLAVVALQRTFGDDKRQPF